MFFLIRLLIHFLVCRKPKTTVETTNCRTLEHLHKLQIHHCPNTRHLRVRRSVVQDQASVIRNLVSRTPKTKISYFTTLQIFSSSGNSENLLSICRKIIKNSFLRCRKNIEHVFLQDAEVQIYLDICTL